MSDSYVGLKKHCCFIHSIQKACRHSLLSSALPTEVLLRLRTCLEYRRKFALLGNSDSKVRQQFLSMLQIPQNMKDSGFSSSWFWKRVWCQSPSGLGPHLFLPPHNQTGNSSMGVFLGFGGGGFLVGWFCFKFFVGFFGVFWGFGLGFCGGFFFFF